MMSSPPALCRCRNDKSDEALDISARPTLILALYQPDIPQNCGTMLRMCACLGTGAAIIGPAGFPTSNRHFRRAGMDYLDAVPIDRHDSFSAFEAWRMATKRRLVLLTTRGERSYLDFAFGPDDVLMVGRETAGVPLHVHEAADARICVPMRRNMRCLNVAVAAAMVVGEALRQTSEMPEATTQWRLFAGCANQGLDSTELSG